MTEDFLDDLQSQTSEAGVTCGPHCPGNRIPLTPYEVARIARGLGVSELIVGLTLVALGTSLPELAASVAAARQGEHDIAVGNVIGSNMFNLLAIIGITAVVHPVPVDPAFLRFDLWVMLGASLLMVPFVFFRQDITRVWGVALSALYVLYILVVLT